MQESSTETTSAAQETTTTTTAPLQPSITSEIDLAASAPVVAGVHERINKFLTTLVEGGKCDEWIDNLIPDGKFSIHVSYLTVDVASAGELRAFCDLSAGRVHAYKLKFSYPDLERGEGMFLVDIFLHDSDKPQNPVKKDRWAVHFKTSGTFSDKLSSLRIYTEGKQDLSSLSQPINQAVQANMRRLNEFTCEGFDAAPPKSWMIAGFHTAVAGLQSSLEDKPKDDIMARCRKESEIAGKVRFQHAAVNGYFPSQSGREVMIFFNKESCAKDSSDVRSEPEALLAIAAEQLDKLFFFYVETVTKGFKQN